MVHPAKTFGIEGPQKFRLLYFVGQGTCSSFTKYRDFICFTRLQNTLHEARACKWMFQVGCAQSDYGFVVLQTHPTLLLGTVYITFTISVSDGVQYSSIQDWTMCIFLSSTPMVKQDQVAKQFILLGSVPLPRPGPLTIES